MSEFSILGNDEDGFDVWIQLEPGDPTEQGETFIIGQGMTKTDALSDAIATLMVDVDTLTALREAEKAPA